MLNGEMKLQKVRWSEKDPEFTGKEDDTGDVTIGVYASALNPLHFGQFESVLRGMAQMKIAQVGVVTHAFDYRKQLDEKGQRVGLNATYGERNEMAKDWIALFENLLVLSDVLEGSEADGERKYEELINLNENRTGETNLVYLAGGGDHMHKHAPSKKFD